MICSHGMKTVGNSDFSADFFVKPANKAASRCTKMA